MTVRQALMEVSTHALQHELARRCYEADPCALVEFVDHVADFAGVTTVVLLSPARPPSIARPRMAGMALAREKFPMGLADIARMFGRQHHRTVIHACETQDEDFIKMKRQIWESWEKAHEQRHLEPTR